MKFGFKSGGRARRWLPLGVALGCLAVPATGSAAVNVLTFEGLQDYEPVGDFYNGGTGGNGSTGGPNYGVSFNPEALALIDSDEGGNGNIANEPSGKTVAFFINGSNVTMNVAAGFTNGFSFKYASSQAASVTVYDGLDGTGNVLGTLPLSANAFGCPGDPGGDFGCWSPVGITFAGVAKSASFGAIANQAAIDDVTLGSATPGIQPGPTTCSVTAVRPGPPIQGDVTVLAPAGLKSIQDVQVTNGSVSVPDIVPGVKTPVIVTATKTDQGQETRFSFNALNLNDESKFCA
jgi:hypothetical protein